MLPRDSIPPEITNSIQAPNLPTSRYVANPAQLRVQVNGTVLQTLQAKDTSQTRKDMCLEAMLLKPKTEIHSLQDNVNSVMVDPLNEVLGIVFLSCLFVSFQFPYFPFTYLSFILLSFSSTLLSPTFPLLVFLHVSCTSSAFLYFPLLFLYCSFAFFYFSFTFPLLVLYLSSASLCFPLLFLYFSFAFFYFSFTFPLLSFTFPLLSFAFPLLSLYFGFIFFIFFSFKFLHFFLSLFFILLQD